MNLDLIIEIIIWNVFCQIENTYIFKGQHLSGVTYMSPEAKKNFRAESLKAFVF